ncbi:hypothetical protein ACJX0J_015833 [Zea mays]
MPHHLVLCHITQVGLNSASSTLSPIAVATPGNKRIALVGAVDRKADLLASFFVCEVDVNISGAWNQQEWIVICVFPLPAVFIKIIVAFLIWYDLLNCLLINFFFKKIESHHLFILYDFLVFKLDMVMPYNETNVVFITMKLRQLISKMQNSSHTLVYKISIFYSLFYLTLIDVAILKIQLVTTHKMILNLQRNISSKLSNFLALKHNQLLLPLSCSLLIVVENKKRKIMDKITHISIF